MDSGIIIVRPPKLRELRRRMHKAQKSAERRARRRAVAKVRTRYRLNALKKMIRDAGYLLGEGFKEHVFGK